MSWPGRTHENLADGQVITVADRPIYVIHTPGHAPGAVCFYVPELEALFSGDTLFKARPGRHGSVVQQLRHDHRLDPHQAALPGPDAPSSTPATVTTP